MKTRSSENLFVCTKPVEGNAVAALAQTASELPAGYVLVSCLLSSLTLSAPGGWSCEAQERGIS
ncbi:MAG: hypothetical protein WBO15_08990, partial [Gammaproteobacteria bacterium]